MTKINFGATVAFHAALAMAAIGFGFHTTSLPAVFMLFGGGSSAYWALYVAVSGSGKGG